MLIRVAMGGTRGNCPHPCSGWDSCKSDEFFGEVRLCGLTLYIESPIPMFFFFSKTWLINSWGIVVYTKFPETMHKSPMFFVYPICCCGSWWDAWAISESPLDAPHIPIQPYTKTHSVPISGHSQDVLGHLMSPCMSMSVLLVHYCMHREGLGTIFFDLIITKYEIYKSQKCAPLVMKCSKSRRFLGLRLRRSPRPPSRKGLLAFGNRSFAPSARAISSPART